MKYPPRPLLLLAVLCLLALLLGGYAGWQQFRQNTPPAKVTISQLQLPDIDKNIRNGKEWLGKVVVVNHWATWCPPCREEIPLLIEYQRQFGARGLQIVGIAHDLLDTTRAYGDSIGINYPSLVAIIGGLDIMQQQGNTLGGALPFTAFFDRSGHLVHTKLGPLSGEELHSIIAPLL